MCLTKPKFEFNDQQRADLLYRNRTLWNRFATMYSNTHSLLVW